MAEDIIDRNSATSSATGTNSCEDELASYGSAEKSYSGNNALEFWIHADCRELISSSGSVNRRLNICSRFAGLCGTSVIRVLSEKGQITVAVTEK